MENPDKPKDPVELPDSGIEKQNIDNPNVSEISIDDLLEDVLEKHAEHENAQRDKSTRKDLTSTEPKEPQVLEIENNLHEINAISRTREKAILDPHTPEPKETKDRFDSWREQWEKDHPEEKDKLPTGIEHIRQRIDVLTKEWSIHLEEEAVRERVAQSIFTVDHREGIPLAPQAEIIQKNGRLLHDLAAYPGGLRAFYRDYDSALQESAAAKEDRMKELMANFGSALNAQHPEEPYTWKEIEAIFRSLTGPENEVSARFIVDKNIEKTEIAASYVIDPSGKVAAEVDRIHSRSDFTPEKRREKLDLLFHDLEKRILPKIKEEDPIKWKLLREKFAELEGLKKIGKGIAEAFEKRRREDDAKAKLNAEQVKAVAPALAGAMIVVLILANGDRQKGNPIPKADHALFEELARTGYPEFVLKIINQDAHLTKMDDGSYEAEINGEKVFLKPVNGTFAVFLKDNVGKEVPIIAGESEDTGFDLARSEKIARDNQWADIAKRPDIRFALLDAPADGHFMGTNEAGRFAGFLRILLKGHRTNSLGRLRELHIVNREMGRIDFRYIRAYKRTFEKWAGKSEVESGKALENLASTIRPGQINLLAERLKAQAEHDPQFDRGEIIIKDGLDNMLA